MRSVLRLSTAFFGFEADSSKYSITGSRMFWNMRRNMNSYGIWRDEGNGDRKENTDWRTG